MSDFPLGTRVRDKFTGFDGIAIGECRYLTGCNRIGILPTVLDKDGKSRDSEWFDIGRVEIVVAEGVHADDPSGKKGGPGGFDPSERRGL
jgi:hypothetical protein